MSYLSVPRPARELWKGVKWRLCHTTGPAWDHLWISSCPDDIFLRSTKAHRQETIRLIYLNDDTKPGLAVLKGAASRGIAIIGLIYNSQFVTGVFALVMNLRIAMFLKGTSKLKNKARVDHNWTNPPFATRRPSLNDENKHDYASERLIPNSETPFSAENCYQCLVIGKGLMS